MTDEGLSKGTRDWLSGAAQRRKEPVREDPREHVQARLSEELARAFHEAYERLAPDFGYKTREASAKPWSEVPAGNRALMTAVAGEILAGPVAVLVAAARADTAGRIAAAIDSSARELNRRRDKDDLDRGRVAGLWDAALIARDQPAPAGLTDDQADRLFEAALDEAGMSVPSGWLLRPDGWAAKGGLTPLVAYNPADQPDQAGRRPSDRCVGMVEDPELAARITAAYNAQAGAKP